MIWFQYWVYNFTCIWESKGSIRFDINLCYNQVVQAMHLLSIHCDHQPSAIFVYCNQFEWFVFLYGSRIRYCDIYFTIWIFGSQSMSSSKIWVEKMNTAFFNLIHLFFKSKWDATHNASLSNWISNVNLLIISWNQETHKVFISWRHLKNSPSLAKEWNTYSNILFSDGWMRSQYVQIVIFDFK